MKLSFFSLLSFDFFALPVVGAKPVACYLELNNEIDPLLPAVQLFRKIDNSLDLYGSVDS